MQFLPGNRTGIGKTKRRFKGGSPDYGFRRSEFFYRMCLAVALIGPIALAAASGVLAATITVNSTADPGASGVCALRDAITAANDKAPTNGCVAGTGTDTIKFSVTGKIKLGATLPAINGNLTITGPTTTPGITIDGGRTASVAGHRIMVVNSGAALTLQFLSLVNGESMSVTSPLSVAGSGGAISNSGTLTISNATFSGNAATGCSTSTRDAFCSEGGAISNSGTLSVTNSTFSNNLAEGNGGAIANGGTLSITTSTFASNQAFGINAGFFSLGGQGGAVFSTGALTVTNSTFSQNHAVGGLAGVGGAVSASGTATVVTSSTFSGNSADAIGGAIDSGTTAPFVTNSTFSGNSATEGAAVFGASIIKGSILAASAGGGGNCSTPHPIDAGDNISDDTSCGFSGAGAMGQKLGDGVNPLLDPKGLQNNGGATQTIALQPTSPAIDAIPFASCTDQATPPQQLKNDQRGKPRPDPADGATGPCDVGAYEFQTPGPIITPIPKVILTGDQFNITGQNFTAGSVVNLFVATGIGVINHGPLTPTARTLPTQLTVAVPIVGLGNGFVSVQVVNTDQGYLASNSAPALLQADPKTGYPTITSVNGHPLAETSSDPRYAVNNVETLVVPGKTVTLGGMGFAPSSPSGSGRVVDLFCACPGGKVGPFVITGSSTTSVSFTLPATGANAPVTGPGSFVVTNVSSPGAGPFFPGNAVSVPIGDPIGVKSVVQSVSPPTLITVNGTGFSTLTVINFFNKQGAVVKNLGGLKPDGSKAIGFTLVNDKQLTFNLPKGAVAGESYVQALNPPFVPFTSSGSDPGGAFALH